MRQGLKSHAAARLRRVDRNGALVVMPAYAGLYIKNTGFRLAPE